MLRHRIATPWYMAMKMLRAIRRPQPGFRILLFHDVVAGDAGEFEKLVEYVIRHHGTINPGEVGGMAEKLASGSSSSGNWRAPCLFSFDDGFISNSQVAAPILEKHGIQALFFICPELTELSGQEQRVAIARNVFNGRVKANALNHNQRLMKWEELSCLRAQGHTIGCHGMAHRRLSELGGTQLEHEIIAAADLMDERLDQKTDWYAYAFGDIDSISGEAMETISSRFQFCRSGIRGLNNAGSTSMSLLADSLLPAAPIAYQKLLLEGGVDFRYAAAREQYRKLSQTG